VNETHEGQPVLHLITSLTIDNILQTDVGRALDALRDAGFTIEINLQGPTGPRLKKGERDLLVSQPRTSTEGDQR